MACITPIRMEPAQNMGITRGFRGLFIGKKRDRVVVFPRSLGVTDGIVRRSVTGSDICVFLDSTLTEPVMQFFDHGFDPGPVKRVLTAFDKLFERTERHMVLIKAGIKRAKLMPEAFMVWRNQQTVFDNPGCKIQFTGAKGAHLYIVLKS